MNTNEKQYFDADGKPISLYKLVRSEPEWAQARVKAGEDAIKERDTYRELCDTLIEDMKNAIEYQKAGIGSIRFLQESIKQAESILGENR